MKKVIKLIILCLLLVSFNTLYACEKDIDLNNTTKKNIALILKTNYGFYWGNLKLGAETAAREFNVDLEYSSPDDEGDISGQIELVNKAVEKKIDALILDASDYEALSAVTEKVYDHGIPVIVIDSEVNTDKVNSYIATDNFEAGKKAGNVLVDIAGIKGNIAVISFIKGSRNAEQREEGLYDVILRYPQIEVVEKEYCMSDTKLAYSLAKKIILDNKNIDAIVALSDTATEGAAEAVEELNLNGKVKIIGFDNTLQEIDFLDKGVIQATIIQNPFSMGYLGVKYAIDAIENRRIEKRIYIDSKVIDRDNMYLPENQKLLFPFIK